MYAAIRLLIISVVAAALLASPAWAQKDWTRQESTGTVQVTATLENPAPGVPIRVRLSLNTHSENLDGIQLTTAVRLRNDRGVEVTPVAVEGATGGGHHREAVLVFPVNDKNGRPLIAGGVKSVEVVILEVGGVKERRVRWELDQTQ